MEFVQDQMGIVKNRGEIFLDSQLTHEKDLDKMLLFLRDFWGTSKQSVLIRLRSLGILVEDRYRKPQHPSEILKGMSA